MDRSFYRFVTIHACDRQTDRILITIPRLHYMQRGKNWLKSAHQRYVPSKLITVLGSVMRSLSAVPRVKTSVHVYINFHDHLWKPFSCDVGLVDSDRDIFFRGCITVSLSGKSLKILMQNSAF